MIRYLVGVCVVVSRLALGSDAQAQARSELPRNTELLLQGGVGMFPYLGVSALATLRTGPLALGTSLSVGTTFYGGKAWEATAGVGYGLARANGGFILMPVIGILRGDNLVVAADCGFFGLDRCDSGMSVSEPFLGVRAQLFGQQRVLAGGLLGIDYTLSPATRDYQRCSVGLFSNEQTCSPATTSMTRVLVTAEFTLGTSVL